MVGVRGILGGKLFSKQVGNYLLGRTLGEGSYAKVKYGQHIETGEAVAIKILDKDRLLREGVTGHVKREIAIMQRLRHPNIVELKEVMTTDDKIFMVEELVAGGELFDAIVVGGRMEESKARRILHELMGALDCAHKQGIYHRDLKPENVLLTMDGTAKLSDFGLGSLPASASSEGAILTTMCGTPNYAAPEVLSREGYEGAPADVWSLGVVLYVITAGALPFDDPSLGVLIKQIYKANYWEPPWFSPELKDLMRRLMKRNPKDRITLAEMAEHPWVLAGGFKPAVGTLVSKVSKQGAGEEEDIFQANAVEAVPVRPSQLALPSIQANLNGFSQVNAFVLISAAIDLSGMFAQRKDVVQRHTRFTSHAEPELILQTIYNTAVDVGGTGELRTQNRRVSIGRRDNIDLEADLKLTFQTPRGPVVLAVEILEVIRGTQVVDFNRYQGDHFEFYKLYQKLVEKGSESLATLMNEKAVFKPMSRNGSKPELVSMSRTGDNPKANMTFAEA